MVLETLEVLPCWELDHAELQCLGLASSSVPHNYMLATRGAVTPFRLYKRVDNRTTTPETLDIILFSVSICTVNCSSAFTPSLESGKFKDLGYLLDLEKRRKCRKNTTQECLDNRHDKPRHPKVHFITSFVTSTEPDTVLTLLETGNEGEQQLNNSANLPCGRTIWESPSCLMARNPGEFMRKPKYCLPCLQEQINSRFDFRII